MNDTGQQSVISLHGIWMPGTVMAWFNKRLRNNGFEVYQFGYASLKQTPMDAADTLRKFILARNIENPSFVGHSLGGLVAWAYLYKYTVSPTRVVALGSPFNGSKVANSIAARKTSRWLLGRNIKHELIRGVGDWPPTHALGVVSGTSPWGVGQLFTHLHKPHDGTVMLEETNLKGLQDQILINTTHTALVFNSVVVAQTINFLRHGSFEH